MGLRQCERRKCENILCDSYSTEHGYICWECKAELMDKVLDGTAVNVTEFMVTPKAGKSPLVSSPDDIEKMFSDGA